MLKFEKNLRGREITVIVRESASFFSSTFMTALTCASLIHLFFLLFFQVVPLTFRGPSHAQLPSQVMVDLSSIKTILADATQLIPLESELPPRERPAPDLPKYPRLFMHPPQIRYLDREEKDLQLFTSIEKEIYEPLFSLPKEAVPTSIQLFFSGGLPQPLLLNEKEWGSPAPLLSTQARTVFNVIVESKARRVFWIEALQLTQDAALNQYAEKILHQLEFAFPPHIYFLSGVIEIQFNFGEAI